MYENCSGALADAIKTNTTQTRLDLTFNNLGAAGAAALADALKTNTILTHLYFTLNNLGDAGAAALAKRVMRLKQTLLC